MNTLIILADCCNAIHELPAPVINEGANDCNVLIAAVIGISVILVAFIAAITLSVWHKKELKDKKEAREAKLSEPSQQEKDKKEYIAKLISFREELSKKDSKLKGIEDGACREYIQMLEKLVGLEKQ